MGLLRIGINASGLAAAKRATGLQRYLEGLVTHLAARCEPDGLRLYLYFTHPVPPHVCMPGSGLARLMPGEFIRWRVAPLARGWHRIGMGLAMQVDRLHVFHFPAPLMAGYCPVPSVVTFHDLAALSLESEQTGKERRYLPDALEAGRRASALIAVSQSAADEVKKHLGRANVTVTPEGVDLSRFRPAPPEAVTRIRTQHALERYVLCVGTLQTRKNHLGLIQAFQQIQDQVPHTLVIAGGDGSGAADIRAYLDAHSEARVRLIGYIEDADLPALYTGADALALPSLWEGFGLPLIEAMACGIPVLTSNISSLAEVATGAALIVDPRHINDIAEGLRALLHDQFLRERLISAGLERARMFSWENTARQTIEVYRQVVRRS
jgi:glycosyltransferase involved in cell wall biosynthesis